MHPRWSGALLALALFATPHPPHALADTATSEIDLSCVWPNGVWYADTLKSIWKPLETLPALVRPGDALTVWANAPAVPTVWSASLHYGTLDVPLGAGTGAYDPNLGRWVLGFTVPPTAPEEIFSFVLRSDTGIQDSTRHSVKVLPAFKRDYYFAQISDTHLPEHTTSSTASFSTCDTSGMADFDAVIRALNVIHPEFILHTGDFVNEGDLNTLYQMNEMGRALRMVDRLRDPMFLVTGNHDVGGWLATPAPIGTSRRDWWRFFGWPYLMNPPAGDPYHCQDYTFDYDSLRVIALESYLNYDNWMPAIWGAGSFTGEQVAWLQQQIFAAGPRHKLLMYHFDFDQGANTGSSAGPFQLDIATLGVDGAIWGHYHTVPENSITLRTSHPFNLGLQSVISNSSGGRTFRIFRVHDGNITPGPMHHAGTALDSLDTAWSGANDGTRARLSATVTNRFGEAWDHARLVFNLADRDSSYGATGGTVVQSIRQGGMVNVYVDCPLPASGSVTVSVAPVAPVAVADAPAAFALGAPRPNPFHAGDGTWRVSFTLPAPAAVRLAVYDLAGRRIATLAHGTLAAGRHEAAWDGRAGSGAPAAAGLYLLRLEAPGRVAREKIQLLR